MDEDTRRHIREAEWERMRARETRLHFQAQRDAEQARTLDKKLAYVMRYGREKAVLRTLMKWTVGLMAFAIVLFPEALHKDGLGQALFNIVTLPLLGLCIGVYRASRLPHIR